MAFLVLTGSRDIAGHDAAVLAGAMGVVEKGEPAETILKAIRKVHEGEIWLDRSATGRIFLELSRSKAAEAQNPEQRKIASLTPRERQIVAEIGSEVLVDATNETVAVAPGASVPTFHVTVPPDSLQVPWDGVAET